MLNYLMSMNFFEVALALDIILIYSVIPLSDNGLLLSSDGFYVLPSSSETLSGGL